MPAANGSSRLMVFMFTDLVDSSALTRQLGDADYVRYVLEPHNAIFRDVLAQFAEAREVKHTGDGFMATFASASDAANCAQWRAKLAPTDDPPKKGRESPSRRRWAARGVLVPDQLAQDLRHSGEWTRAGASASPSCPKSWQGTDVNGWRSQGGVGLSTAYTLLETLQPGVQSKTSQVAHTPLNSWGRPAFPGAGLEV
jgi:hypothetical protein